MKYLSLIFVIFTLLPISYTSSQAIFPQEIAGQKSPVLSASNIHPKSSPQAQNDSPAIVKLAQKGTHKKKPLANESITLNSINNKTQPVVVTSKTTQPEETVDTGEIISEVEEKAGELGPGALGRAVIVFVLVSFVFLLYVGLKTCRKRKANKAKTLVHRKYGVRTTRSDMEMEPLPLSDDEDDNTIFDSRLHLIPERNSTNK